MSLNLQKAPIVDFSLQMLITYLLLRVGKLADGAKLMTLPILASVFLFFLASGTNLASSLELYLQRVFLGEFVGMTYYLWVFEDAPVPVFPNILPPYIFYLLFPNDVLIDPGNIVISYFSHGAYAHTGTANTIFMGGAYAYLGELGLLFAPFVVVLNIIVITFFFTSRKKTLFSVFLFGFLLYKLTKGLTGGITYYFISSTQILFLAYVIYQVYVDVRGSYKWKW